jgi:hypothetical protein
MEKAATVTEVWKFFGRTPACPDLKAFQAEWKALSDEEKEFFKTEVGKTLQ